LFVLSLLLQYFTFALAAPTIAANATGTKLLGGFEVDGDLFSGTMSPSGDDWAKGATGSGLLTSPTITDPIGNADTSNFSIGSKENDNPLTWNGGTGTASPKDDMGNIFIGDQLQPLPPGANSHLWTFVAVERASNNGTTFFDFEFNQKPNVTNANGISVPHRTAGDILVVAQQQGSGSFLISGTIQKWTGSAWGAAIPADPSQFYGLSNDAAIPVGPWADAIASGGTIGERQFAEMAFDLTSLGVVLACPSQGFGEVNVRTRSSITDNAALKDYASAPVDIPANCASLSWQKQDDKGNPLGGATFTVDPNPFTGSGAAIDVADYVSASAQSDPTKDQDKRAGFFKLINVVPGTYTVTEKTAPAGYILDPTSKSITLEIFEDGSISYVWKDPAKAQPTLTTSLVDGSDANGKSTLTLSYGSGTSASFVDSAAFGSVNANHLPTGNVVYHLYDDAGCTHQIDSSTVAIAGGLIPNSKTFTLTDVGTYRVTATYAGDAFNDAATNACGDETVTLPKNKPAISTSAAEDVTVGASISDSATLSGATADAGGSITFKAYGPDDATCSGTAAFTSAPFAVSGNDTYGPASFSPATAGTYRWIASYSGDAKNLSSTGACNDEGENDTVNKDNPGISTVASADVTIGGSLSDTATVSGGNNPTGTVTFKLYGPNDATCTGTPIFTSTVALSGTSATSGGFAPSAVGTYRWIATYNGDVNNNTASGACNDDNESAVVNPAHPSITTSLASGDQTGTTISIALGASAHDTSTLTNSTATAGGTVHYQVFSDATCQTLFKDAGTKTVTNHLVPNSDDVQFNASGNYYWQADYSGDAANDAASSNCSLEIVSVGLNQPTITTNASDSVVIGGDIHDTATLAGGFNPTGTITFQLYGPDDATCATAIFTTTNAVSGNGDYVSAAVTVNVAGTYRWIATYSGDSNNAAIAGKCNDAGESVIVTTPNLHAVKLVATGDGAFGPTSVANPGDVLHFQITVSNSGNGAASNVPVSDNIAPLLAHASYNADCSNSCSFGASTLTWTIPTIAAGGSVTLSFSVTLDATFPTGTTHLPNVVVVTGPGSNCAAGSENADCDTDTTVATSVLTIDKAVSGNTGGTFNDPNNPNNPLNGLQQAKIGDTLTYSLHYVGAGPLTHAVITDPVPAGLAYVAGSATGDTNFDAGVYDPTTRTITWNQSNPTVEMTVPAEGTLTFKVTVLAAAADIGIIDNVATIHSDQTPDDQGEVAVGVLPPPEALTPPPTDTFTPQTASSNPGFSLMLILLGVAGLTLGIGLITPAPARVRRRNRLG
jgi:uncharacterized repeat protein (TIGR01451 family)/fimbrial isopeptide formation D2 family protein